MQPDRKSGFPSRFSSSSLPRCYFPLSPRGKRERENGEAPSFGTGVIFFLKICFMERLGTVNQCNTRSIKPVANLDIIKLQQLRKELKHVLILV
jgi:hypothetical protein